MVGAKLDTTHVEVAVKDTGIGIAPEDQAAVFEEFHQVGRDYTRKDEGTGLGLALTKRFVELHGGTVRLESAPGKGSTFTFTLPVANEGARMSMVLIVEDNEKNMKLVRDVLQAKGYETLEAVTARRAWLAHERKPDLVLMDIQLPGMNGIEALRQCAPTPRPRDPGRGDHRLGDADRPQRDHAPRASTASSTSRST